MTKSLPLQGYKVIELATVVAAPTAGRLLSDYGAEVIKIEMPPAGDPLREMGEMHMLPTEPGNNPLFDTFNSGKKLISVDLKKPEGFKLLTELLADADVFISNIRPQSLEKLGLGYETRKESLPRLVYAHFSGFGLKGPDKDRPGYDTTAFWMRTGAVGDWLPDGGFPARPSFAFGDIVSAAYFLNGILMALLARERTGHGTMVSTSLLNTGIWANATSVVNTQPQYGRVYPNSRYDPWNLFSDYYRCADGVWIAPVSRNYTVDRPLLARLFDAPELVEDPDCVTVSRIRKAGKLESVIRRVGEAVAKKTAEEWIALFEECDLPYETVRSVQTLYRDRQAWENGFFENVSYPDGSEPAMPVPPIIFTEYARRGFTPQRELGADTDGVLASVGYSGESIERLKKDGVIK